MSAAREPLRTTEHSTNDSPLASDAAGLYRRFASTCGVLHTFLSMNSEAGWASIPADRQRREPYDLIDFLRVGETLLHYLRETSPERRSSLLAFPRVPNGPRPSALPLSHPL